MVDPGFQKEESFLFLLLLTPYFLYLLLIKFLLEFGGIQKGDLLIHLD